MKAFTMPQAGTLDRQVTKSDVRLKISWLVAGFLLLFLYAGRLLQGLDSTAAVLDIGILSTLLFAVLAAATAVCGSLWLLESVWKPFQVFRENFHHLLKQLTPWQQCITYFSVFFLSLYACLWALRIVL